MSRTRAVAFVALALFSLVCLSAAAGHQAVSLLADVVRARMSTSPPIDHVAVIPMTVGGVSLVCLTILAMIASALSETCRAAPFRRLIARLLALDPKPVALTAFILQLTALFGMESLEQMLSAGHLFGGTEWLGGPVLLSLGVHAFCCVVGLLGLRRLLVTLGTAHEYVLEAVAAWIAAVTSDLRAAFRRRALAVCPASAHSLDTFSRQFGRRGPPIR